MMRMRTHTDVGNHMSSGRVRRREGKEGGGEWVERECLAKVCARIAVVAVDVAAEHRRRSCVCVCVSVKQVV